MKNKHDTEALNEKDALQLTIVLLKNKQTEELKLLKEQFYFTYESIKPINVLKNALREATSSPDLKSDIVSGAIGLTTGYLSRKVLLGASNNPMKNILGTVLQFAIANIVSKHSGTIKSVTGNILQHFLKNKAKQKYSEIVS